MGYIESKELNFISGSFPISITFAGGSGDTGGGTPKKHTVSSPEKDANFPSHYEAIAASLICSFVLTCGAGRREEIRKKNEARVPLVSNSPHMTKMTLFTDASSHLASQGFGRNTRTQHTGPPEVRQ